MEGYGCNYIHISPQSQLLIRKKKDFLFDFQPKNVKKFDFLSILHSEFLREYKKSNLKIGDRVRISKCQFLFRKACSSQFTQQFFLKCCDRYPETTYIHIKR